MHFTHLQQKNCETTLAMHLKLRVLYVILKYFFTYCQVEI